MKVCMLAYTFYESDNRVRRYAETLVNRGDVVDVVALRRKGQNDFNELNGVRIYRIQEREINEKGRLSYLYRLLKFFIKSFIFVGYKHLKNVYDLVHVHSIPDFEVFAALLPKLAGSKIILDIHDIVPEFYCSKFGKNSGAFLFRALVVSEKLSISYSDHVIISNNIWYNTLISRSTNKKKCTVILNYPDNSIFFKRNTLKKENKFIMMYPGTLNWHQGLDIAIKAFAIIKDKIPEAEFHIYGDGPTKYELAILIKELGLQERIFLKEPMSLDKIAEVMASADVGIVPKRDDPFGGEAFSTKTLEFMSLGVPIIVSKTKIDQNYFDDSIVKFFNPEDEEDLSEAMLLLINNKERREELSRNAQKFIEKNKWEDKKYIYLDLVDSLVKKGR